MRTWFWTLLVFGVAVGLALVLREHAGNVLIIVQPWRIELSLALAVLLILALFCIFYVILRVLAWIGGGPERFRSWRGLRAQKRDHELLESGWINVLEGRYTQAQKELSKLLGQTRSSNRKVLAALALARASHHQGEFARRDEALKSARDNAGNEPRLKEATATVAAEMYLDQHRPQDAMVLLQPLQDASTRHFHATRLLLQAHRQLKNHGRVYDLTRLLLRRGAIERPEALQLIEASTAARLQAAGADGFKAIWSDLKSDERLLPEIALAGAAIQESIGNVEEASKILEAALNAKLEPRLLGAYAQCPPEHVARRLNKAEVWLKANPDNPDLLAALGSLCLTGQLWGQGEHYLLRSKKLRSDVRIHALLGNLYDRLGRQEDAARYWRLASGVAGLLPTLPTRHELPAADTRGDPTLLDVDISTESEVTGAAAVVEGPENPSDSDSAATQGGEPAQAAPPDRALPRAASPAGAPAIRPVAEDDEYFDSAPIPGVDLSQTSDRPSNGSRRS